MRFEYKYLIHESQLSALRSALMPFVKPDKFAAKQAKGHYTVRSIYFDTRDFDMYKTKIEHLAHRLKVRLRGYDFADESTPVFCEIKRKYEGPIVKNRATLPFDAFKKIFKGASIDELLPVTDNADNIRRFFYQIHKGQLRPCINIIYEREAYESKISDPENGFRISIDKNLRSVPYPGIDELFDERDIRFATDGMMILEIKFNSYCPVWIKPILASFDLVKLPASKYVLCIDSQPGIRPDKRREIYYKSQYIHHHSISKDKPL